VVYFLGSDPSEEGGACDLTTPGNGMGGVPAETDPTLEMGTRLTVLVFAVVAVVVAAAVVASAVTAVIATSAVVVVGGCQPVGVKTGTGTEGFRTPRDMSRQAVSSCC